MATLRDVAKLSGVSTATVSNVLNARNDRVSPETRDRVLAAVRKLRYRPTALEKDQKAILTQNLGVMVMDLTKNPLTRHGYLRLVLDGVMEAAMLRGWSVTIFAEKMWDDLGLAIRRSYDGRCDGLVLVAPSQDNETVQSLRQRGVPLVLIGSTAVFSGVSSVDIDNEAAGALLANHLLELGHRRFAFVGESHLIVAALERERGFRAALDAGGVPSSDCLTYWLKPMAMTPGDVARDLSKMGEARPTGVMGWHDGMSAALLSALPKVGLYVPHDLSVVGVDDAPESHECRPNLTTVPQPLQTIGKRAANLLIDRLGDEPHPDEVVRFSVELLVRGSSGPAPRPLKTIFLTRH